MWLFLWQRVKILWGISKKLMSNPRNNFLSRVYEKYRRRSRLGSESQHTTNWKEFFMWWNVSIFTYWICLISMSMLYNMLQYLYWFLSGLAIDQLFAKLQTFDLLGFITRQHSNTITQKFGQLFLFIENLSNQCTNTKSSQSETKCNALQDDDRQCQYYRSEERRVGKECRSRWSPYH